jgi:hypothetical protein
MKVVRHQAVSEYDPALTVRDHAEEVQEVLAVFVVPEDRLAANAPPEHVKEPAGGLKARFPSHPLIVAARVNS